MKKIILKITMLFILLWHNNFAQIQIDTNIVSAYDSINQIYRFKPNLNISATDLVSSYKSNFRLTNNSNTLLKVEEKNDSLINGTFYRFTQHYNNVPIENSMFNLTYNNQQKPVNANGKIYDNININVTPSISNSQAINNAIASVTANTFYWQDSIMESDIKIQKNDTLATYYPSASLVILPIKVANTTNYYLCYKIRISIFEPNDVFDLFVDANSGTVIYKKQIASSILDNNKSKTTSLVENNIGYLPISCNPSGCQVGTANLHKYGSQYINTDKFNLSGFCRYRLKDNCTGTTLYTRKYDYPGKIITDIKDNSNNWTSGGDDQDGMTAHWSLERTHDYYRTRYGRNSWDGNYTQLSTYLKWAPVGGGTNARFTGNSILVSFAGSGWQHPVIFLDGIGHEFTHGVTMTTAGLLFDGSESAALNESFSDMFGTMIEFYGTSVYSTGQSPNYIIGELSKVSTNGIRDMSNPKTFNHPDTYLKSNWDSSGEEHINAGPANFWFFLLAEGSSSTDGVNDNGDSYCIQGIGRDKAIDIAWVTLTTKLYPTVQYADFRALSILAAEQLYGTNSNEVAQVTNAWHAVGVGSKFAGVISTQNITVNSQYDIHHNTTVSLQNVTVNNGPLYVTSNTEIQLLPDININQNSVADLYIAPYDCSLGARFSNTNGGGKNTDSNTNTDIVNSKINESLQNQNELLFNVQPNPNNGEFKLTLNNNNELPKSITIRDYQGKEVKTINNPTEYELNIDLKTLNNGLFIITANYGDVIMSKRIIKQ